MCAVQVQYLDCGAPTHRVSRIQAAAMANKELTAAKIPHSKSETKMVSPIIATKMDNTYNSECAVSRTPDHSNEVDVVRGFSQTILSFLVRISF